MVVQTVKNLPALRERPGFDSWVGKNPLENGNPLQCSCLENPMDRGDWQAAVQRVAESDATEHTHTHYPLYGQIILVNVVVFGGSVLFLTGFVKTMTQQQQQQKSTWHTRDQIAPSPHFDASSSAYLIGLQILEVSNSGDSGPENFSKHKPYHS